MKKSAKKPTGAKEQELTAADRIDAKIASLKDWRGAMLSQARTLIQQADPEVIEEIKWVKPTNPAGVPVWSHAGILCTGEVYKQVVKLTFPKGASLADPQGLFNSSLEGNARRAIDIHEGEELNAKAFKALVLAAIAANLRNDDKKSASLAKPATKRKSNASEKAPVKLLSGGNPQIAKADGDAPVQAYIAAMPGWKSDLGQRLDALIERAVPGVQKAVRWNSPFYGVAGQGWFVSFHVLNKYVKVTFFAGKSLDPIPPGGTPKSKESRWIDIYEDDKLDESQMTKWFKQAAKLPGWSP